MKYFTTLITVYLLLFPLTYSQSSRHIQGPARDAGEIMQVNVDNAVMKAHLSADGHSHTATMGEIVADPIKLLGFPL